ncbi:MAG: hypothetical protein WCI73_03565 [Phycisphaerae bacterium]
MFTTLLAHSKMLVLAGAAVAGLTLAAGPASAGTHWSFGISFNVPVAPAPVYYAPVVVAPQPVYTVPPVVYAPPVQYIPAPTVCVPPPVMYYAPPAPFVVFGARGHDGWDRGRMDRDRFEHGRFGRR